MSSDIRSILEKFSALTEGTVTPATVKKGLNKQQKSVPQLPALFKPKSVSPVLGSKTDPQHPMKGYMVGASEAVEPSNALEEAMQEVEEEVISRVRKDLANYLDKLSDKTHDDGNRNKDTTPELDKLSKKERAYRDMIEKAVDAVAAAEEVEEEQSSCVETVTMEDGSTLEIHGTDGKGFEIRRQGRALPTRFPNLDHAKMAIDIFKNRRLPLDNDHQDLDQDYIEER